MTESTQSKLRPHQGVPTQMLLDRFRAGHRHLVDLSDMGTGKTYVAAAVAHELQWPTLVICPFVAMAQWQRAAAHFGDKFSIINYESLGTGRQPYGTWENQPKNGKSWRQEEYLFCLSCQREIPEKDPEPCYTHPQGYHCVECRKRKAERGNFIWHPAVKLVIFDEIHRCAGLDTQASEMLIATKRQGIPTLGLSATAACSPLQLRALGYCLGLHTLVRNRDGSGLNFFQWARRYGVSWEQRRGWKWDVGRKRQLEIMAEIRRSIIPRAGVRVTIPEIPGFPKCDISAELYNILEPEKLNALYKEMEEALDALTVRASADKNPDHPLTRLVRACEKTELLKVPIALDLAEDYARKGYSPVIFCNFRSALEELNFLTGWDIVDGSPESVRGRQHVVDRFTRNETPGLLVNSKAGGVALSLPDLSGDHPRVGLVMPTYSAVNFRQIMGRLPRVDSKSDVHYRVLFAAGTVEVDQHASLSRKLDNLDALNDEDLSPGNLKWTAEALNSIL